jgi:twitching motility protein PilJ
LNGNSVVKYFSNQSKSVQNSLSPNLMKFDSKDNFPKKKLSAWQRFANLPISRKQIFALLASELISIVGLTVVSRFLIATNLQVMSARQAKSELAIIDMAYNIKVNQMGFGFRGQSDNAAIIKAAINSSRNESLNSELKAQVKQILVNEVKARKIEYATLVGKDLKIIVNANSERQGEVFDPDNLVSEVLNFPKQIKASRIVKWSELNRESPPLPSGLKNQDALIRYTVTPVIDPATNIVLGALVSGDIVNNKDAINQTVLDAAGGGYSAIYYQTPNGELTLSTSLASTTSETFRNLQLPNAGQNLLREAIISSNDMPTARMTIGNQAYVVAAKAIPNKIIQSDDESIPIYTKQPVAILVRGTPEIAINQLLANSFWVQLLAITIAILIILIWALIVRKTIISPIKQLQQTAFRYFTGDRTARADVFAEDEIGELAFTFNQLTDNITEQVKQQEDQVKIAQIIHEITARYRSSFKPQYILDSAAISIKSAIQADRVIIYRFDESWHGQIISESVNPDFPVALGTGVIDPIFAKKYVDENENNLVQVIPNIYESDFSDADITQLEKLAIKASLITPILINNRLYGLLIAHQCSQTRQWQNLEINLLKQVAIPIGYALEQESLNQRIDDASSLAEMVSGEKRQQQAVLQQQISRLITEIANLSQGNFNTKLEVTSGQMGDIAESFNSMIDHVGIIITQIQSSSSKINTVVQENENVFRQLSQQTQGQTLMIGQIWENIQPMTNSIETGIENSDKVREITQLSLDGVQSSLDLLCSSAQNIATLRTTIDEMKNKVKKLGESSLEIDNITDLVSEIGTQANLLAVNTELQAARKNQDGSLLSIATNLGDLAIRCAAVTQEVETIVNNNQRETLDIIQAMDLVTSQVVKETNITEGAKSSLNQTLNVLQQISDLVTNIKQETIFQLEKSQTVQRMIQEIYQVSELNSSNSQKMFQAWQETWDISQELQVSVTQIKVN